MWWSLYHQTNAPRPAVRHTLMEFHVGISIGLDVESGMPEHFHPHSRAAGKLVHQQDSRGVIHDGNQPESSVRQRPISGLFRSKVGMERTLWSATIRKSPFPGLLQAITDLVSMNSLIPGQLRLFRQVYGSGHTTFLVLRVFRNLFWREDCY